MAGSFPAICPSAKILAAISHLRAPSASRPAIMLAVLAAGESSLLAPTVLPPRLILLATLAFFPRPVAVGIGIGVGVGYG